MAAHGQQLLNLGEVELRSKNGENYKRQSRRRGKRSCGGAAGNYAGFGTPL